MFDETRTHLEQMIDILVVRRRLLRVYRAEIKMRSFAVYLSIRSPLETRSKISLSNLLTVS